MSLSEVLIVGAEPRHIAFFILWTLVGAGLVPAPRFLYVDTVVVAGLVPARILFDLFISILDGCDVQVLQRFSVYCIN